MKTTTQWMMLFGIWLAYVASLSAATVTIPPVADTFLSEFSPTHNTGGHIDVAAGTVSNGTRTRALLRFDIAAYVPAGATISSVSLRITATRVNAGGGVNSTFDLRRVLVPWSEGTNTSNLGAPASAGEATWSHRLFPDTAWGDPGGAIGTDFSAAVSGSTAVAGLGPYDFASSPGLVQDVQFWLDNPSSNFGWVLMTELEGASETSRRFASREDAARAPTLTIDYMTAAPPFRITGLTVNGNQAVLTWTNGRPGYQVQMRSNLTQNWVNLGPPTNATTVAITLTGQQAFFRVVQDYIARYQVLFNATWSQQTHPTNFPVSSAHWSGLVGGAHNDQVHFWREGETASEGIRMMAELGSQPRLLSEVRAAITNGTAHFTLAGGGINPAPGNRLLVFPQPMQRDYSLVTLCSMIAPSPDWFVGVDSLNLIEAGQWVTNKTVTLYGFDAGTDSGATYTSADQVTTPRGVVTRFTGFPALVNGVIVPFGTFTFTRLD
jgi:hypothetical protein